MDSLYDDIIGSFRQLSLYIKCIKKENFRGLLRSFRTTYTKNHFFSGRFITYCPMVLYLVIDISGEPTVDCDKRDKDINHDDEKSN